MRLIDADSLIELFTPYVSEDKKVTYQPRQLRITAGIVEDIKNAPTVEAIPIEWIEDYANEFIRLEESNYFAYRGLGDYGKGLLELIEKWREQKEGDER